MKTHFCHCGANLTANTQEHLDMSIAEHMRDVHKFVKLEESERSEGKQEIRILRRILHEVEEIEKFIHGQTVLPTGILILQGAFMITGVQKGGSATFQESFVPTGSALPPGASSTTTWTVDDPLVTLTPATDGVTVIATVDPSNPNASFKLTASLSSSALPSPITSGPVDVPILPTPPPLPTALSIDQIAALK